MNPSAATSTAPVRRRRWFAFSLRTLLVLVTLVAVFCGTFVVYVKPYWDDQRAWERVELAAAPKLPARMSVGRIVPGLSAEFEPDPSVPKWLRHWAGEERFRLVRAVKVEFGTDDLAREIAHLRHVRKLELAGDSLTDASLAHLRGCRNLRVLDVQFTKCTFHGLRQLADLPLEVIRVSFPLTDEILTAGAPVKAIVPRSPLVLQNPTDLGLRGLNELTYWSRVHPAEFRLELEDGNLSAIGIESLISLPIQKLTLRRMRLQRADRVRLLAYADRFFSVSADRASLDLETLSDAFMQRAVKLRLGPGRMHADNTELFTQQTFSPQEWRELFSRGSFAKLESLDADFQPTPDLFRLWAEFPNLKRLECEIDDQSDLSPLFSAPALETLVLYHTNHSPAFWRTVRELPQLRELRLCRVKGVNLDAQALREIASAKGVTRLSLSFSGIDDEELQELAGMTHLETLELRGIDRVTDAGRERLRRALPRLEMPRF